MWFKNQYHDLIIGVHLNDIVLTICWPSIIALYDMKNGRRSKVIFKTNELLQEIMLDYQTKACHCVVLFYYALSKLENDVRVIRLLVTQESGLS